MHAYQPAAAITLALLLAACSGIGKSKSIEGASSDKEAVSVKPEDPMARPIQVGWTSARASYCGFIFNPDQLRANFLASEAQMGLSPEQMQKAERAYDYTRRTTYDAIKENAAYCSRDRTAAIRKDLNRYLAGDFSPGAKAAR